MRGLWAVALATILGACGSVQNSGVSGPNLASIKSTKDPGVYKGFDRQIVVNEANGFRDAIFRSSHPGAAQDGVGTTDWLYVRSVDLDRAKLLSGTYNLSDEVVRFFRECAPTVSPNSPSDAFLSGRLRETSKVRLVLTQLAWHTEVGPGPGNFSKARVSEARVKSFGSTASVSRQLSFEFRLTFAPSNARASTPVFARKLADISLANTRADCSNHTLKAPWRSLGGSDWFPRGDVNNIRVEIVER